MEGCKRTTARIGHLSSSTKKQAKKKKKKIKKKKKKKDNGWKYYDTS